MGAKLGFTAGLAVGLLAGSRAGRGLYDRTAAAATSVVHDPRVRRGASTALHKAGDAGSTVAGAAARKVHHHGDEGEDHEEDDAGHHRGRARSARRRVRREAKGRDKNRAAGRWGRHVAGERSALTADTSGSAPRDTPNHARPGSERRSAAWDGRSDGGGHDGMSEAGGESVAGGHVSGRYGSTRGREGQRRHGFGAAAAHVRDLGSSGGFRALREGIESGMGGIAGISRHRHGSGESHRGARADGAANGRPWANGSGGGAGGARSARSADGMTGGMAAPSVQTRPKPKDPGSGSGSEDGRRGTE